MTTIAWDGKTLATDSQRTICNIAESYEEQNPRCSICQHSHLTISVAKRSAPNEVEPTRRFRMSIFRETLADPRPEARTST